jgi:hypothetical protein
MYKIFCIGQNKTGTTSLTRALSILGYRLCPEDIMYNFGSVHFKDFQDGKFDGILNLVNQYDVFEDRPWNHTDFYKVLDKTYEGSKFILTTRDAEQWWDSYIRWNNKIGLKESWHYRINSEVCYGVNSFLDNPELSKQTYLDRNNKIKDYFSGNPNFLVLDINDDNKFEKLCGFLNKEVPNTPYPYMNYNGN